MFLTRMAINPSRRGTRLLLDSPQAMHAAVLDGFPPGHDAGEGRVLWRVDTVLRQQVSLYVVSPQRPDLTHLVEQAGWPAAEQDGWQTRSYEPLLDELSAGQRYRFRLTANPVRAQRNPGYKRSKAVGHVTVAQQEQWLLDRAAGWGFSVVTGVCGSPDLSVTDRAVRRFRRGVAEVTLSTATYEGHLEVTDAAALRRTLAHGAGRAKAYGCGLLTLGRAA